MDSREKSEMNDGQRNYYAEWLTDNCGHLTEPEGWLTVERAFEDGMRIGQAAIASREPVMGEAFAWVTPEGILLATPENNEKAVTCNEWVALYTTPQPPADLKAELTKLATTIYERWGGKDTASEEIVELVMHLANKE